MTKSQLIEVIASRAAHVPRQQVEAIVNAVFDTMVDGLKRTERIEIRGFGSLAVKVRAQRNGRNPKTGQKVFVPARRTPFFTCGKELKARLNPELASSNAESAAEATELDAPPPAVSGFEPRPTAH